MRTVSSVSINIIVSSVLMIITMQIWDFAEPVTTLTRDVPCVLRSLKRSDVQAVFLIVFTYRKGSVTSAFCLT